VKAHHRNIPFRPPRKVETAENTFSLYKRFVRAYMWPHRWLLFLCMTLVAVNASSVYLLAFYGRIIVDHVLVVAPQAGQAEGASSTGRGILSGRKTSRHALPGRGSARIRDSRQGADERPPEAGRRLLLMFVVYIATRVILNMLARLAARTRVRVGRRIAGQLREDMHKKVLELELAYHKEQTPGRLLSRIVSDVEMIQQRMMVSFVQAVQCLSLIAVGVTILLFSEWRLCLVVLAVMPVYAFVYAKARPRIRDVSREMRHTNSCMFGLVTQKLEAIKSIHAYGRERLERLNFHRLASCFLRDALLQQRLAASVNTRTTIINGIGTATVFLLSAHFVMDGRMSLGKMLFVYRAAFQLFAPVLQLAKLNLVFAYLGVVLQRAVGVLDRPATIVDDPDAMDFPGTLRHAVQMRDVHFSYDNQTADGDTESVQVFRGIDLTVPAGSWLCVMGPSGCGKTTLLYLLGRLYEPSEGCIMLDDVPLSRLRTKSIRKHVGFVPQEAQIFSGTMRDNICYGARDADPARVMAAARAAELHDFIVTMPVQYETRLDEKGASLSGGQRQRLSLARALITDPEILLLDDCTSALDAETERRIQDTLTRVLVGKTAVIVSQRVSMAKRCHRICTIVNGRIAEYGTHDQLVNAGGFYSILHAQQTE